MNLATQFFANHLKETFIIEVNTKEIASETITLHQEEVDLDMFPQKDLKHLPDPLILYTATVVDKKGIEWTMGIVLVEKNYNWLYITITKNGKLVETNFTSDGKKEVKE